MYVYLLRSGYIGSYRLMELIICALAGELRVLSLGMMISVASSSILSCYVHVHVHVAYGQLMHSILNIHLRIDLMMGLVGWS